MFLITIVIFLIILTVYLHIAYQLKTSNDMEVFETTFVSKEQLDNICNLRQPIIFDYIHFPIFERDRLLKDYGEQTIVIKSVDTKEDIPYLLKDAVQLIDKDTTGSYYIEKNHDFIIKNIGDKITKYERDIRPIFTGKCIYDILIGGNKSVTPLKYEICYRNFFLVVEGTIQLRFAPPKSEDYLNPQIDYDTLDTTSSVNCWKEKVKNVQFIDIVASKGQMIHIPPYWWYSIQFTSSASVVSFKYRTYMNTLTILPQLCMQILQLQNMKPVMKKASTKKLKKKKKVKQQEQPEKQHINKE